jgi:hypothetical protein
MFEIVKAIHEALGVRSTWAFALVVAAAGAVLFGVIGAIVDLGYKNSLKEGKPDPSRGSDIINRISALISEGNSLQNTCQTVPDPYKTPAQNRADLVNAIGSWKQRVENALAFDSDPRPLQIWKAAVLWHVPETPEKVALYCTELNVRMDSLNRILARKTLTPEQRIGQLNRFISEGNSIKQTCLSDKVMDTDETQWMTKVMQWLGDNFDDTYAQDFNHALHPVTTMPGNHPPEITAMWNRMQARIDVLNNVKSELSRD